MKICVFRFLSILCKDAWTFSRRRLHFWELYLNCITRASMLLSLTPINISFKKNNSIYQKRKRKILQFFNRLFEKTKYRLL